MCSVQCAVATPQRLPCAQECCMMTTCWDVFGRSHASPAAQQPCHTHAVRPHQPLGQALMVVPRQYVDACTVATTAWCMLVLGAQSAAHLLQMSRFVEVSLMTWTRQVPSSCTLIFCTTHRVLRCSALLGCGLLTCKSLSFTHKSRASAAESPYLEPACKLPQAINH